VTGEKWVPKSVVLAVHDLQLAEHGGLAGMRDEALLDSDLARARNLAATGDADDFEWAAAYMAGIIKNHPFVDGNKRTGFLVAFVFLDQLGHVLDAPEADTVEVVMALAAGELEEAPLAHWLRDNCKAD
jgi:death-on-curing protein